MTQELLHRDDGDARLQKPPTKSAPLLAKSDVWNPGRRHGVVETIFLLDHGLFRPVPRGHTGSSQLTCSLEDTRNFEESVFHAGEKWDEELSGFMPADVLEYLTRGLRKHLAHVEDVWCKCVSDAVREQAK